MPSIWANFDHMFEVFQGLFFAFFLERKIDAVGTRFVPYMYFKMESLQTLK